MAASIRGAIAAAVVVTAVFAASAGAQTVPQVQQVQLTPAIVEVFIASYPDVRQTADGLEQQYGVETGGDDPSAGWQAWLAVTGAQNALNAACRRYGFQDFQQWLQVFTSVAAAYVFVREGGMDAQMAAAIAQIRNNPNLSEAQKQMMVQQMQAALGMVNTMMPPQINLDAVAPYAQQLAVLFEDA